MTGKMSATIGNSHFMIRSVGSGKIAIEMHLLVTKIEDSGLLGRTS